MTEAPAPAPSKRRWKRQAATRASRARPQTAWISDDGYPIEIVAHDRYCRDLLLEYAAPLFTAEIVSGPDWAVRLRPPPSAGWVLELLALVERWLESARLPCAKVLYGGRSYLIRRPTDFARPEPSPSLPAHLAASN
jgi:hypothetical protein